MIFYCPYIRFFPPFKGVFEVDQVQLSNPGKITAQIVVSDRTITADMWNFGNSPEEALVRAITGSLLSKLHPQLVLRLVIGGTVFKEKYQPSSGEDFVAIESYYCSRCHYDQESISGKGGCDLVALASIGEIPDEWQWSGGTPICRKFAPRLKRRVKKERTNKTKPKESPGQLSLFD